MLDCHEGCILGDSDRREWIFSLLSCLPCLAQAQRGHLQIALETARQFHLLIFSYNKKKKILSGNTQPPCETPCKLVKVGKYELCITNNVMKWTLDSFTVHIRRKVLFSQMSLCHRGGGGGGKSKYLGHWYYIKFVLLYSMTVFCQMNILHDTMDQGPPL